MSSSAVEILTQDSCQVYIEANPTIPNRSPKDEPAMRPLSAPHFRLIFSVQSCSKSRLAFGMEPKGDLHDPQLASLSSPQTELHVVAAAIKMLRTGVTTL